MTVPDKSQVVPCGAVAFGIQVDSRHGLAWELAELLQFAQALAERDVERYVVSALYDSNANLCEIELAPNVRVTDPVGLVIREAAAETLTQFNWNDQVMHGRHYG